MKLPCFIQAAHDNDVAVHLWTINDPDEMRQYLAGSVDGLITDFPDRAVVVVGETAVPGPKTTAST